MFVCAAVVHETLARSRRNRRTCGVALAVPCDFCRVRCTYLDISLTARPYTHVGGGACPPNQLSVALLRARRIRMGNLDGLHDEDRCRVVRVLRGGDSATENRLHLVVECPLVEMIPYLSRQFLAAAAAAHGVSIPRSRTAAAIVLALTTHVCVPRCPPCLWE